LKNIFSPIVDTRMCIALLQLDLYAVTLWFMGPGTFLIVRLYFVGVTLFLVLFGRNRGGCRSL